MAKHAQVSATTASFVLSGRTDMRISSTTADRVHQAARILGYAPPLGGRLSLVQKMPALAFISDTVATEPFAGQMLRGATVAASERGMSVVLTESQGATGLEVAAQEELLARGIDRFVYATTATREVRLRAAPGETRTVLLNCHDPRSDVPAILPDDREAGARAARLLLGAGHTDRIWLVGDISRTTTAGRDRRAGLLDVLEAHHLGFERHLSCSWWPPDTRNVVTDALRQQRPPTAIVALNDRVAMGVYQAAGTRGLRIPEELSVVSFDNSDLAWWLDPGLTALGMPYFEMGRRAVEVLLGDAPERPQPLVALPLHERQSIAAPTRLASSPIVTISAVDPHDGRDPGEASASAL